MSISTSAFLLVVPSLVLLDYRLQFPSSLQSYFEQTQSTSPLNSGLIIVVTFAYLPLIVAVSSRLSGLRQKQHSLLHK